MSAPIRITLGIPNDSKPIPVSVASNKQRKQIDVTAPITAEKVPKYEGPYSVTPTESVQTLETDGKRMEDNVDVGAIPSNYVGSEVSRKTSADLTASGPTVTAPAGYYSEAASASVQSGSVSVPYTGKQVTPEISVSEFGTIYATVDSSFYIVPTVNEGYVTSGEQGRVWILGVGVKDLSTQAAQTITPTTEDQTIAKGKYLTGAQTIKGDANLLAENIKKDVQIFDVTGSYEGGGGGLQIYSSTYDNAGATISLPQGVTFADMTANVKAIEMTDVRLTVNMGDDYIDLPRLGGSYDSGRQSLFFGGIITTPNDTYMVGITAGPYYNNQFDLVDVYAYSFNESDFVNTLEVFAVSVEFIK